MTSERRRAVTLGGIVVAVIAVGFASLPDAPPTPLPEPVPLELPTGRLRVEVLNGGGVRYMARDATALLRDSGVDVVDFGNASTVDPERPSTVIDRVGQADAARAVADVLGIDNVRVEPDPNLYVDVTVLLGSEWRRPGPRQDADGGDSGRVWWDPRSWLDR